MIANTSMAMADTIGLAGVVLYVLAYFLLQIQVLASDRYTYTVLNLLAAGCVLFSLQTHFNLASAIIQISWIAISLLGLTRIYLIRHHTKFSEREHAFLDAKLAHMPPHWARRILDLARWCDGADGETLTHQGEPVAQFSYILDGKALVFVGGKIVAEIGPGTLVGELSCLHGTPASATVVVQGNAQLMQINASALRRLCRRVQGLEQHLELSFGREMRDKLLASNHARVTEHT